MPKALLNTDSDILTLSGLRIFLSLRRNSKDTLIILYYINQVILFLTV